MFVLSTINSRGYEQRHNRPVIHPSHYTLNCWKEPRLEVSLVNLYMSEEVARERGLCRAQTFLICGTLKSKLHRDIFRMLLLRFLLLVLYRCGTSPVTVRKGRKLRLYKNKLHEFMFLLLRVYPPLPREHCFMLTVVMMCDEVQPISLTSARPAESIKSLVT